MKGFLFVLPVLAVFLASLGDVLMERALKLGWYGLLLVGVSCLIGHFLLWMRVLKKLELSVAHPFLALYYLFNSILVVTMVGESLSLEHWAGTLLIVCGVGLVSKG